jgi:hypothetical protein
MGQGVGWGPQGSLPVAIGSSYGLLCTSGFHRPLGLCEGRQSWRQPNGSQSATSNCNTHDPVTRRPHRQHLVHPQFVRAWMWSKVGFASWNLLFSQMGPRWAGSGSGPWGPQPTPWPTAAPGGAGREGGGGALHRPYGRKKEEQAQAQAQRSLRLRRRRYGPLRRQAQRRSDKRQRQKVLDAKVRGASGLSLLSGANKSVLVLVPGLPAAS